jgi:DNA primase
MQTENEDIIAIIGKRTELTKRGNRYTGRCPFHDDRIPSLFVNPKTQFFFCFGCRPKRAPRSFCGYGRCGRCNWPS